jgi:uncharacterized protein YyaL (SSP411 family)
MNPRFACGALLALVSVSTEAADAISWQPWSESAFAAAKREKKFVIMDLEAVWCHWCHVMDETTYRDPRVISLMGARYVAVKVDQDSRPDLANRYEDYGWPATIVFAADGSEIVRRRGYLNPAEMASMLQAIIDDPSPGPSVTAEGQHRFPDDALTDGAAASAMRLRLLSGYDRVEGGWSDEHKFLDADNVEYCLRAAARGDREAEAVARDMLRLQRQIFDPVWGGVYQYSAGTDWVHPHFEKIMSVEADNLRVYSMAASLWPDWGYPRAAGEIARYLGAFLRGPEGAYFTSQDADLVQGEHSADYFALDDEGRRARGVPRVDTHRYSRENGWAISSLCAYSDSTGDPAPLGDAEKAAQWVLLNRALPGGGFRHDQADAAGPFLGDTLAMGSAFLSLYQSTGDRAWLPRAVAAADFIGAHFALGKEPGYATSDTTLPSFPKPKPEFDESVALARFGNRLSRATDAPAYRVLAEGSLRWALPPDTVQRRGSYVGGLLLAMDELGREPLHVTVVGPKDDPVAQALFRAARRAPASYKLVEWWDRREGGPPRGKAIFPDLGRSAAFLCANGACSAPIKDTGALSVKLAKAAASEGP